MRTDGPHKYKAPEKPTREEVLFLIDALKEQKPPSAEIVVQAIEALRWLELQLFGDEVDEQYSKGGAPRATQTTELASIVVALKEQHRVPIKRGVWAVEPADNPDGEKRREAIKRKCSDIRNGKADSYFMPEERIQAALMRAAELGKIKNRK
jgi:hypothetical protein